jgi:hypothetical protein
MAVVAIRTAARNQAWAHTTRDRVHDPCYISVGMATSIFRSPLFWGGVGLLAVGAGVTLYRRRSLLQGSAGPEPHLVQRNTAKIPPPKAVYKVDGMTLSRYEMKDMSIDQRLKLIQRRTWDGVNDPRIRKLALQITRDCGRDDGPCEAQKVFDAVKTRVRYTGDVGPVKNPETGEVDSIDYYQKPWITWDFGGGDCDDAVGLISSLLAVIGHTMRLRVTATSRGEDYSHIYPVTLLPKHAPKTARAVDITLPWKARVGSEANYGKARDYLIEVPA